MIRNLIAIAYFILAAYLAFWLHMGVFASHGEKRLARFTAYIGGACLLCGGLGLMMASVSGGWHYLWAVGYEVHTSLREGLMFGVCGAIPGVIGFIRSEMNGGQMFFELITPEENWGHYTRRILTIEPISSAADRRRTAKFLVANAAKTTEELTPELRAYMARNGRE